MKSLVAILTYRRLHALQAMMAGLEQHCPQYATAIFEDCGNRDGTTKFLTQGRGRTPVEPYMASLYTPGDNPADVNYPNADVFIADRNLGVAGNSNRALRWFLDGNWDHLCLCNDDLLVNGDFVKLYAQAHQDLGVQMFCYCPFDKPSAAISGHPDSYKWTTYPWRGYNVKFLPRFTGIMMSITRELVEKIGFFDAEFGKFGEEHSDYTIRARFAGGIRLDKQDMNCLDIEHKLLGYQEVATSVTGPARANADREASFIMQRAAHEYRFRHYHRPFHLTYPAMANGYSGVGIPCRVLNQIGYKLATALV